MTTHFPAPVNGRPDLLIIAGEHSGDEHAAQVLADLRARQPDLKVACLGGVELQAAGAQQVWKGPVAEARGSPHLLGTCRMGNDPTNSVVDRYHRTHDIPNLFICDGSSFVTSGRGQPTMTIQALAFRAGEHIAGFARRHEI